MSRLPSRLLIVEDEAVVARLLDATARDAGIVEVEHASTAAEALELAARHPPELVIMDVSLESGTAGLEAARKLISAHGTAVIFLTGNPWLEETCLALPGQVQFLRKPFLRSELEAALAAAPLECSAG